VGAVYVVDPTNHRIQKFGGPGNFLCKWGSYGSGNSQFSVPSGIAVSALGLVYVADGGHSRIEVFGRREVPALPTSWGRIKGLYR
jgi:DNA-binding beta-propeller fold protein YncE